MGASKNPLLAKKRAAKKWHKRSVAALHKHCDVDFSQVDLKLKGVFRSALFITFEGGEGSGKSTQVKMLAEYFRNQGREVVLTREPGGTPEAERIRHILLTNPSITPLDQCYLNFTAREDHVKRLIKPALNRGDIVISDRFFDSTYAYQGYAQGVPITKIRDIQQKTIGAFKPDITFILDIDPKKGIARAKQRGKTNHYDDAKLEFHQKIRTGFLKIAAQNKRRCKIIDASANPERVFKQISAFLITPK